MRLRLVGTLVALAAILSSGCCCWHRNHTLFHHHCASCCDGGSVEVGYSSSSCGCGASLAPPMAATMISPGTPMPIAPPMSGAVYSNPLR